jgi:hypothetical protein
MRIEHTHCPVCWESSRQFDTNLESSAFVSLRDYFRLRDARRYGLVLPYHVGPAPEDELFLNSLSCLVRIDD